MVYPFNGKIPRCHLKVMVLNHSLNQILNWSQTQSLSPTPLSLSVKRVEFVKENQTITP